MGKNSIFLLLNNNDIPNDKENVSMLRAIAIINVLVMDIKKSPNINLWFIFGNYFFY